MSNTEQNTDKATILEKELLRLIGWNNAVGSRIALVLPLSTAMLGALAVLAPSYSGWTPLPAIFTAFAFFFLVLSIIFSAFASFPRTNGPKGSLIYFGGISSMELDQYLAAVKSASDDEYIDDLGKQCHRNAQIADKKYTWMQKSLACLFISALPWAASLFLLYSMKP